MIKLHFVLWFLYDILYLIYSTNTEVVTQYFSKADICLAMYYESMKYDVLFYVAIQILSTDTKLEENKTI